MKRLLVILFLSFSFSIQGQTHEWANVLQIIPSFLSPIVSPISLGLDSNNNSYIVGNFARDFIIENDTFNYINNYISPTTQNTFISKFNKNGQHSWTRTFHLYSTSAIGNNSPQFHLLNVKVINNNKVLAVGKFTKGTNNTSISTILKLSQNDSIVNSSSFGQNETGFYVYYDSIGNITKFGKLYEGSIVMVIWNGQIDIDKQENIYLSATVFSGTVFSSTNNVNLNNSTWSRYIIKYTKDFDSITWCKALVQLSNPNNANNFIISRIRIGIQDSNLYVASILNKSNPDASIKIDSFEYKDLLSTGVNKGLIIVLSSSGDFVHHGLINLDSSQHDNIFDIAAFDTSKIYITGFVQDSINYKGEWYTSSGTPTSQVAYPYIAKVSISKANWIKLTTNKIGLTFNASYFRGGYDSRIVSDKDGFVYCSFRFQNNVLSIGGLTDSASGFSGFVKMDSIGNALWLRSGVITSDMQVDLNSDLVYCGGYNNDTLELPPFVLPFSQGSSGFIAKITDYSITRGEVSAGPYCAGDTFYVPYTKMGEYDTANWFISELSDENGNFEGGERELGRIKATEDSTIIGQLPLFQVASSPNYRIRVRSTHPPVQSFYRLDSLRLLIFSRDKADPGPAETVCFGDSFMLNTFGGTAWQWSPAYRMDNSNARNPKIYPDRDTVFQIIISDSSGCGAPDTAFKQIYIRDNPKVNATDTIEACLNFDAELIANFSGGDSSGYKWTWYSTQNFDNWQEIESDSFANAVTFFFRYPAGISNPRRFAIVLDDGCSIIKDTALLTVRLTRNPMKGTITSNDSLFCYQSEQDLIGNFTGGDSGTYTWEWFEADFEAPFNLLKSDSLKTSDSLIVQLRPQNTQWQRYALVSKDECTPFVDTTYFTFNIAQNQPRAIVSPQDSTVCNGTPISLFASIDSGSDLGYHWKWQDEDGTILQSDTGFVVNPLEVTPDFSTQSSQTYTFILFDNCSPYSDTSTLTVFPREALQVIPSTFDTTLCNGQEIKLTASGTGGDSSNYQYQWLLNDSLIGTEATLNFQPSTVNNSTLNTHNLKLVLSDGCMPESDTVEVLINVRPALSSYILSSPFDSAQGDIDSVILSEVEVCSGSEIEFFAKGFGGDSTNYTYEWYLDDNLIGSDSSISVTLSGVEVQHLTLIINDDCTVLSDTQTLTISILPPLEVSTIILDTLCLGEEIELIANGSGGIDTNYTYQWFVNDSIVNGDSVVTLRFSKGDNINKISLVLSDGCSSPNDTFTHEIYVRPKLDVTLSAVEVCANPTSTLTANPSGGNPDNYFIQWEATPDPSSGGEWQPIGTGLSIEVTPSQLTTYRAILTDGCSADTAFAQIQIDLLPSTIELIASPTEGCEPLEVEFTLNTNYSHSFSAKIYIGSDSLNINNLTLKTFSTSSSTLVLTSTLHFTTQSGCSITVPGPEITVHPKPNASFSFSPEEPDLDSALVQFKNLSTGAINYNWTINPFGDFSDFEPQVNYTDTGYFDVNLIAVSNRGCRDTAEGQVYIRTNYRVFFPNAFSPNGDGLNDVFGPALRGFGEMTFRIYNRWGEQIYITRNNQPWDGTYKGQPAQMDVYFYTLNVISFMGERQEFTGTVQLIR